MTGRGNLWFARGALAYLALVLLQGGASSGGLGGNLLIEMLGAVLLGWRLWLGPVELSRQAVWVGRAVLVLAIVQVMPLPPALWTYLPGRAGVAQGFVLLGEPLPWLTVSLAPWRSLASLAGLIPSLALFTAMRGRSAPEACHVAVLVVALAAVSVALGLIQWHAGVGYVYGVTNYGRGPGFFANSNHQSNFLLIALALGAGWAMARPLSRAYRWGLVVLALWLLAGLAINMSLACIALLPVEVMVLALQHRADWRRPRVIGAMALVALATVGVALSWPGGNDLTAGGGIAGLTRLDFLVNGLRIWRDFMPIGTGLGAFEAIYRWYEEPALAGATFVNHAHDDWLEFLIEGGVLAMAVIAGFALWLRAKWLAGWQSGDAVRRVVPLCIVLELAHSLVDYPLRTAALAGLFAVLCAWID
jgi:O-antigen ligase